MAPERINHEDIQQSIVKLDATVGEVLEHMHNEAAMIVDETNRLHGLITDGDIRRAFLNGANMSTPVSEAMTCSPMTIQEGLDREEIMSFMLSKKIRHLPVVDKAGRPIGLELLKNQYDEQDITKAVLMAGGKGTRLHPLTHACPKPLLNVGNKPILDNILENLKNSGVNDAIISVNYLAEQIRAHVANGDKYGMNIAYVEEEKALGTAGALSLLSPRPTRSFIVMNADLITKLDFRAFKRFHKDHEHDLSVCVRQVTHSVPFGVVSLDENSRFVSMIEEKPEYTYLVNAGIYMMEPHLIELIPQNEFFDMVSLIKKATAKGCKVGAFPIYEYWRDIGRHQEMEIADQEMSRKNAVPLPSTFKKEVLS